MDVGGGGAIDIGAAAVAGSEALMGSQKFRKPFGAACTRTLGAVHPKAARSDGSSSEARDRGHKWRQRNYTKLRGGLSKHR
jgi:hypothetical protein